MPPRQKQQQQQKKQLSDAEKVALIAGAIAIGASAQKTAELLAPQLGIPVKTLVFVLLIAMSKPVNYGVVTLPSATASSESSDLEPFFRAQYVLASAERLEVARKMGNLPQAKKAEQRYFNQHVEAVANRKASAAAVDKARSRYGDELGWYAILDSRTSPECKEANGKNFSASRIPPIGYPGSVHPHCRCRPGRKHATSKTVYGIKPDRRKAA